MGFPIPVRCHLYIESGPWCVFICCPDDVKYCYRHKICHSALMGAGFGRVLKLFVMWHYSSGRHGNTIDITHSNLFGLLVLLKLNLNSVLNGSNMTNWYKFRGLRKQTPDGKVNCCDGSVTRFRSKPNLNICYPTCVIVKKKWNIYMYILYIHIVWIKRTSWSTFQWNYVSLWTCK